MCGVDTSFWMKSFRPIFLSLMKAEETKTKTEGWHRCRRTDRQEPGNKSRKKNSFFYDDIQYKALGL